MNADFTVSAEIPAFTSRSKVEHSEPAEVGVLHVNGTSPGEGVPPETVRRDFIMWMKDNGIGKIVPLAHNLGFDMKFLLKTFPEASRVFWPRGRDGMRLALAVNDISVRDNGKSLFPCFSISAVKETLGIAGDVSHSVGEDARDAAAVYRKMLKMLSLGA